MPRGLPDYGIPQYALATPSIDMATLVLAQTGICSVDGKGRIFYADNFHGGLSGFTLHGEGDAPKPYPSTTNCYIPPLSAGFNPGTLNGSGWSWIEKYLAVPDTEKIGMEVIVAAGTDHTVEYGIQFRYCYADGSAYHWVMYWNTATGQIRFYNNGVSINLDTYFIDLHGWVYTPIKMVGNIVAGKNDRLLVGNRGYNLSAYTPNLTTLPVKGMLSVALICKPTQASTSGDFGRFGYMILTIDEP
jgi:hypothetical protein